MGAYEADRFAHLVPQMPYSVWTQPSGAPLDGFGGWVDHELADPPHGDGPLPPNYFYGHYFGFVNGGGALGVLGLFGGPASKGFAFQRGRAERDGALLSIPFAWQARRALLPARRPDPVPGSWAAWVFDDDAGTWTSSASSPCPRRGGSWPPPASPPCPGWAPPPVAAPSTRQADVLFYPPVRLRGGVGSVATAHRHRHRAGGLPAGDVHAGPWQRYQMGVVRFT